MTVTPISQPVLATIPRVELMHVGTWDISTGEATFTGDDLRAAIAAQDCPAVRRPVLKLGHTDPRFDGEPAVGWIGNLSTDGSTLWGDYTGMPRWLADVAASAYPDRSIEGWYDYTCQLGHTHPFVLTGVALLGVTAPGIGTLESLQDVATLYGVAASQDAPGDARRVVLHERKASMPNPAPLRVAASTTVEDVRRKFYEDAPWSQWIEEVQLEPLQVIVCDDESGERQRIPITLDPAQEGDDAVTFGAPVPVVIRYEDKAGAANVAAAASRRITYASRAESRPAASEPPATEPEESNNQEGTMPDLYVTDAIVTRLGLEPDTEMTEDAILSAIESLTTPAPVADPTPAQASGATKLPKDGVWVSRIELDEIKAAAADGRAARQRQQIEDRDSAIKAAIAAGKIGPARKAAWAKAWDADPEGTAQSLLNLEVIYPTVAASGYEGHDSSSEDITYTGLFGDDDTKGA